MRDRLVTGARVLGLIAVAAVFLLPLLFMLAGSLRRPGQPPPDGIEWLPDPLIWTNFDTVGRVIPLGTLMRNSLAVVVIAVPLTVVIASMAGFAIVSASARARRLVVIASVVALMVPVTALWVPRFVLFRWLNLTDTLVPLMAPALMATTPFFVLLFALTYWRIPRNVFDAARLDGLSPAGVWRRVAIPLSKPTIFAVGVLAFVTHWSNFIEPVIYLSSPENFTLPLGLRALQTLEPANHPLLLAGSVLAAVPPVIAFLFAQRAFFTRTLEGR